MYETKKRNKRRKSRFLKTYGHLKFLTFSTVFLMLFVFFLIVTIIDLREGHINFSDTAVFENVGRAFLNNLQHPIAALLKLINKPDLLKIISVVEGALLFVYLMRFFETYKKVKPHKVEDASDYGAYGTASFATKKDIFEKGKKNFHSDLKNEKEFGSLIGQIPETNEYIIRKASSKINSHTLGVAGSGSGKTTAFCISQIILNKFRSIVASDGKGELYKLTSKEKAKQGFKIIYIDFVKFSGNCWNPLKVLTFDEIDNFSTALVESTNDDANDIWGNQAINYISACIAYVMEELSPIKRNMKHVRQIMNLGEEEVKELFEDLPDDSIAKDYFSEVADASGNTWTGIMSTAKSATRFWKQERIRRFTETSDFDFTDLGTEKIALYLRIHPTDKTFRGLINTFFKQLFNTLIEEVDRFGGRYPVNIDFVLDEFTNVGEIPNFQAMLSFVRALGLNIMPFVQDIAQLVETYGEHNTKSIIANCDNFVFLGTNEESNTAQTIMDKLGETTIILRNESDKVATESLSNESQQYNYAKRNLMTKREVLDLDQEEGLYFASKTKPIRFRKVWSYKLFDLEEAPFNWHLQRESFDDTIQPTEEPGPTAATKEKLSQDLEQEIEKSNPVPKQEPEVEKGEVSDNTDISTSVDLKKEPTSNVQKEKEQEMDFESTLPY